MPRYEDRYSTRLYVGHLSSRTRSRDLEDLFSRYGRFCGFCRTWRVRDVDMKRDYAFVDFSDPRDADDARYSLNGRDIDGSRIIVEFSRGGPRGPGGSRGDRDHGGSRGPPPGSGRCFNCGIDGHWARDCKAGDWKNKCYRCGERGHVERNCQNSPKKLSRRGRSYSRSPSPRPRRGGRSPSRSRSYSRSRSPPRRERGTDRSRSPRRSRSPKRQSQSPPVARARKHSPTPDDRSPRGRVSLSPRPNGSDYGESPRPKSRSPVAVEADRDSSPQERGERSPMEMEANGGAEHSPSPAPRNEKSVREDDEDDYRASSPRGSE